MSAARKEKKPLLQAATLLLACVFSLSLHTGTFLRHAPEEPAEKTGVSEEQPLQTGACGLPPGDLVIVAATHTGGANPPPHAPPCFQKSALPAIVDRHTLLDRAPPLERTLPVPIETLVTNRTGGAPPR